ncbi:MAG TPA: hypothetical protein VFY77_07455 [Nitrososphaeraceae archaeon]|nr:hypothetical protein [Nitrososphaeraceae archaeon]HZB64731.1 hypothetical protein [Nitrososphaeraceae archaeon]
MMSNKLTSLSKDQKIKYLTIIPLLSICIPSFSIDVQAQQSSLINNTSNSTANIKGDRINLPIENLLVERSVTNLIEIKGDVKNNSTLDLHEVKVSAEYYDKTGTLLEKVEHFITSPSFILKPNEQVSFDSLEVIGFQKLGDYNIVASGESLN